MPMTKDEARSEARRQICDLKARYCRYIDTKLWDRLPTLYRPDATFEGFGSAPPGADVSVFVNGVSTRLQTAISVHHCHMPEITFQTASKARAIWAMEDYVEWPEGTEVREVPGHRGFKGYGHYEEEYALTEGKWLITFMRLTRLRIDPLPNGRPAPKFGFKSASPDWLLWT